MDDRISLNVPADMVANRLQVRLAELVADYELKIAVRDVKISQMAAEIETLKAAVKSLSEQQEDTQE